MATAGCWHLLWTWASFDTRISKANFPRRQPQHLHTSLLLGTPILAGGHAGFWPGVCQGQLKHRPCPTEPLCAHRIRIRMPVSVPNSFTRTLRRATSYVSELHGCTAQRRDARGADPPKSLTGVLRRWAPCRSRLLPSSSAAGRRAPLQTCPRSGSFF